MREFKRAVVAEGEKGTEREGKVTFPHWDTEVTFFKPTEGQEMAILAMGGRGMSKEAASTFLQIFTGLADAPTRDYIHDLMLDPTSGFTLKGEGGVFDIWEGLVEHWSGKASGKPSASAKSRSAAGRTSTATSRRRASPSSKSRSTGA